jgi:hypothetical protein
MLTFAKLNRTSGDPGDLPTLTSPFRDTSHNGDIATLLLWVETSALSGGEVAALVEQF